MYVCVRLLRRESSTCGSVGLLPIRWVGGEGGGVRKTARGWQPERLPNSRGGGEYFSTGESGTVVPPPTNAASAPWSLPPRRRHAPHKDFPKTAEFGADVGNVAQGQGVPDHQVLPICGAQHARAFGSWFRATARAACSGCVSHQGPAARPRQCFAVGVCPTKALLPGLGSALQQFFSKGGGHQSSRFSGALLGPGRPPVDTLVPTCCGSDALPCTALHHHMRVPQGVAGVPDRHAQADTGGGGGRGTKSCG